MAPATVQELKQFLTQVGIDAHQWIPTVQKGCTYDDKRKEAAGDQQLEEEPRE